jgi:hypothetical protein
MLTDVSEVSNASIISAMMEAASICETSVNIYLTTWQYIPADSKLNSRRGENLKSHVLKHVSMWGQELAHVPSQCSLTEDDFDQRVEFSE